MDGDRKVSAEPGSFHVDGEGFTAIVVRNWSRLLEAAQRLHDSGEYSAAVIVAHTACEVVVAKAIAIAFERKGQTAIGNAVNDLVPWYSLKNDHVRSLYGAVTGDIAIQKKNVPFWNHYVNLVNDRCDSVHGGTRIPEPASRLGVQAARDLVAYVITVNNIQ